jgi:hypothetical protein
MSDSEDTGVVMPFGKYKGRLICDVPKDYLEWFADNVKAKPFLALAVANALGRKGEPEKSKALPSKSVPSLTITGSNYVLGDDASCPFDCE